MAMVVIKVKYGDVLRRFNARVVDEKLDLSFDGLREKVASLFKFSTQTELELTYVDEDNDDVTLADDEDLIDVVRQGLDPLRITVKFKTDAVSKPAASVPSTADILDFAKLCLSDLERSDAKRKEQPSSHGNDSERSKAAAPTKGKPITEPKTPNTDANFSQDMSSSLMCAQLLALHPPCYSTYKPFDMYQYLQHANPARGMADLPPNVDRQFLYGARCYGCSMYPIAIAGPWFKSKLKDGHALCNFCFPKMGKAEDYVKMDPEAAKQAVMPPKEYFNNAHRSFQHAFPYMARGTEHVGASSGVCKLNSHLIQDVNIFDGTIMAPLTPFTKIWRLRNNGTVAWPQKTQLVWTTGDLLCERFSFELEIPEAGIQVNQELDVAVDFVAPELPGQYISFWKMSSPSGEMFGPPIRVLIQVVASLKENELDTANGFDLNTPPVHNNANDPAVYLNEPPVVEDNLHFPPMPRNLPVSLFGSMFNPAASIFAPPTSNLPHPVVNPAASNFPPPPYRPWFSPEVNRPWFSPEVNRVLQEDALRSRQGFY